jgi:signal transduction histidine kinase
MVLLNSTTRRDPQGNIVGVLGVGQDITELKKVQTEMESLLHISNQQNDRLRNFAYIVSHNLRSHSGGISGILELVETIQDLTEIVKINLSEVKDIEINIYDLLKKNIESLRSTIHDANFNIINEVNPLLKVRGVTAYLDSILLNFITNAIKYRSKDRDSFLKIYAIEDKFKVHIYFQDNGLGIDLERNGHKLFGMYKTFHEHKDSRGLGLFITKNQIESMDGKIEVESEVNIGTTFKITLNK